MTLGAPSSPGVPEDFAKHTVLVPYNNVEKLEKAFHKYKGKIAAVIVEPVAGNMGVVTPAEDFLPSIRKLCNINRSILVFDEVITGFRIRYGSIQKTFGVEADLTCLGKIIGGGFPIGACAGKANIMDFLSPNGNVYQAGTLSGNPVCVAAGIATLETLKTLRPYARLRTATEKLCSRLSQALSEKKLDHTLNQIGSMFTLFFNKNHVTDFDSAGASDTARYARYFRSMLEAGIYLPPSQFEACFISTEHKPSDFDKTIQAVVRLVL